MSYQVIARKWRPQTFEEVTGQEAITRTLRNAVEHDRLHHAYLFSGARGVGKTTTARLLAKALNCHKSDKPTVHPCSINDENVCASCREIAESRSIDVLEFDAASHTGVDDIREIILASININPARDRYKIFIIDEVHMLSTSSFNALLKTLEEPPPRVAFIMATTELHKVPDTILSRCQEFEFRTIPSQKILDRLKIIAEAEKIDVSNDALREIARSGEGSMRDAQSNFDQVISFSGDKIESKDVVVALGLAGAEMLTKTVKAIAENKPAEVLNVVDDLIGRGQDLRNFCRDLLSFFRDLLIYKMAGDAEHLLDTAVLSRDELKENSAPFSESDLIRFFNSLSETESKLREATQPRYVLEIGLVKLVEMRRVAPIEKILERLAQLENALANANLPNEIPIQTTAAERLPEKKTLTVDFPLEEIPFPVSENAVSEVKTEIVAESIEEKAENEIFQAKEIPIYEENPNHSDFQIEPEIEPISMPTFAENAAKSIEAMPLKFPPISSEDLEHIEDSWLDDAYERRLQQLGDDLKPIHNASNIVEVLLAENRNNLTAKIETANGAATAAAPAKIKSNFVIPDFDENESTEMPVLPENPTEEQMWEYAQKHPLVKKALRIFRGKLIEVRKV
ncbi:MAG: DNA polymerase III subunit gamma/tau [Pyrinomonadaceae bacterium]|nr:DNA polymerase III subunit gamma/tau [Pyrinomonadaceae bacterium]